MTLGSLDFSERVEIDIPREDKVSATGYYLTCIYALHCAVFVGTLNCLYTNTRVYLQVPRALYAYAHTTFLGGHSYCELVLPFSHLTLYSFAPETPVVSRRHRALYICRHIPTWHNWHMHVYVYRTHKVTVVKTTQLYQNMEQCSM